MKRGGAQKVKFVHLKMSNTYVVCCEHNSLVISSQNQTSSAKNLEHLLGFLKMLTLSCGIMTFVSSSLNLNAVFFSLFIDSPEAKFLFPILSLTFGGLGSGLCAGRWPQACLFTRVL